MKSRNKLVRNGLIACTILILAALLPALIAPAQAQEGDLISRPGEYEGYSEETYDSWVRSSQYVTMRDGTQLAVDIIRPASDGVVHEEPLPAVWTHTRYQRARFVARGVIYSMADFDPNIQLLLRHGYIVAIVDARGSGASFGTRLGEYPPEEALDAYDITEWLAAQPWCDGNIGMFGRSYLGITQYFAASTQPPHLRAIFPEMAMFDQYSFTYPGGVFREDFISQWGQLVGWLDTEVPAAPVDDDPDGVMLAEAVAEHANNLNLLSLLVGLPYRDSLAANLDNTPYDERSPSNFIDEINGSGVAIYHLAGWYDMWPRDALLWFTNLTVPQKITITDWSHGGDEGFDLGVERLRWFDYWLKGIDNGIMDEPPIYFRVMGASGESEWRFAETWPLPETEAATYYFQAGPSGSVESVNDGLLLSEAPTDADGQDDYTVDDETTTGSTSRWTNGYGGDFDYPDMTANDERGLTYTTAPLAEDTIIIGHPVVHLWVTSTADDGDFFVYLEEVDPESGVSEYRTEGVLRASHRAISEPPFAYLDLPFHRSYEEDVEPLPEGEPVELVIDLHPTANVFDAGNAIRVAVTGADSDNYQVVHIDPPPTVSIYRSADHASHIVLPVIPAE